jgi:hypothetical protein
VVIFSTLPSFTPVAFFNDERVRLIRFEPETDAYTDPAFAKETELEAGDDGALLTSCWSEMSPYFSVSFDWQLEGT